MAKKIVGIFKCRNCGAILKDKVKNMYPSSTEWMLKDIFKGNEEYLVIGGSSVMGEGLGMIHRCEPEKLCVCDFVGWEVKEDV